MKKSIIFTALVFSSITFAEETQNKDIIKSDTPCFDAYKIDMLDLQESFCASYEVADAIATRNFEKCLDETYGLD
jgi:hypothetical protein